MSPAQQHIVSRRWTMAGKIQTTRTGTGETRPETLVWLVGILVLLAGAWMLRLTMWITAPFAISFFIALAVWPIVSRTQRLVPNALGWLGYVFAMSTVICLLAAFCGGTWFAASQISSEWPKYADEVDSLWEDVSRLINSNLSAPVGGEAQSAEQSGPGLVDFVSDYALTVLTSFGHILSAMVLIFFVVLLMLTEARIWRDKLADTTTKKDPTFWVSVFVQIGQRFRVYLLIRALLGMISAVLYGAWLWAFGIDFIPTWMLLTFILNFVPTIGSLISGILPAAFAFLQKDPGTALVVGLGILGIEQVVGNYLDPKLQGRQLSLSPLVVLGSLVMWGWIWGAVGAVLAVPMTLFMLLVFARIPSLEPVSLLLSGERNREAPLWLIISRRLAAGDHRKASPQQWAKHPQPRGSRRTASGTGA